MKRRKRRMRMRMRKLAAAPAAGWRMTTRRSRSRIRIPRRTPPRTPPRRLPSWLSDRPLGARTCPRDRIARSTSWCPHPRRPGPASCRRWIPCLPWTRARGAWRRGRDGTRSRTREPIDASRREIQKIVSAPGAAWPLRGSRGRPRGIAGPRSPGPRGTSRSWLRSFRRRGYARVKTRARGWKCRGSPSKTTRRFPATRFCGYFHDGDGTATTLVDARPPARGHTVFDVSRVHRRIHERWARRARPRAPRSSPRPRSRRPQADRQVPSLGSVAEEKRR